MPAAPLTIRTPGKINLHLRVFPPTADGFHPLRSWFRTVELFDELAVETLQRGEPHVRGCSLWCDDPGVPTGADNLVCRAHAAYHDRSSLKARYRLAKHIPAGGGLGGGSSDAAATLALCHRVHQTLEIASSRDRLLRIAADLGSDVPFFLGHHLDGTTDATCTGRGESVEAFTPSRRHAVLLILPGLHVATPAVFRRFDALPPPADNGAPDFAAWSALPATELLPRLRNDLEPPAFALHPTLAELQAEAERRLGRPVRMTGSGSTLFTVYDDPDEARSMQSRIDVRTLVA